MYAAILHLRFPAERHADVVRFLDTEMAVVIADNPGFVDFRVLDAGVPGELVMIDTWHRRADSEAAAARPTATAVHARYTALGITVASAQRYEVVVPAG